MARPALLIDSSEEERRIGAFIRKTVEEAGAKGVVLGLSGGIDSAVVGELCTRALGKDRVLTLLMPSENTPDDDVEDARSLARGWGVATLESKIEDLVEELVSVAGTKGDRVAKANVQARLRMVILYWHANTLGRLVAGTGDRSEIEIGFYSKFGDGGVDFLPIAHLYKTQVRQLGAHLGLPERIVNKPASPQLWPGHRASDELPADYEKLDLVLHYLFDEKFPEKETAARAGVGRAVVGRVINMHSKSAHKRAMPPSIHRSGERIRSVRTKD